MPAARRRLAVAIATGLALSVCITTPALAETGPAVTEDEGIAWGEIGAGTFDLLVLRPLGAIASAAGFAFFVGSLPLVAPSWEFATTWDAFVLAPVEYTFERPLGDF